MHRLGFYIRDWGIYVQFRLNRKQAKNLLVVIQSITTSRIIYSFPVMVIVPCKYRSKLLPGCSSSLERFPSNKDSFVKQLLNILAWEQEQKHIWWQLIMRVNKCEVQVFGPGWGRCLVPLITALLQSKGWTWGWIEKENISQELCPGSLVWDDAKSCVRQSKAWEREDEKISQQPCPQWAV